MKDITRREFLEGSVLAAAAVAIGPAVNVWAKDAPAAAALPAAKFKFGLCTYLWGKDWDLPALIKNCEAAGYLGVELRTQHKHGVETKLSKQARAEVKKRFADSKVENVGMGCNWQFHENDPARVRKNIEGAKAYVKLCADVGGSGVKVKPNGLVNGVPVEKTVEQIGKSLNELGKFGADYNCEIRVEVHGRRTSELPIMKAIFDVADHKNVGVCWNCNAQDLQGKGLEHNFNLVKDRFAATAHVRELDSKYPYQQLMNLFRKANWGGWILLEARTKPKDRIAAMKHQLELFKKMTTA